MGEIPCDECEGKGFTKIPRFIGMPLQLCNRCHGSAKVQCPHEDIEKYYKDISLFVKCFDCGDEWEVIG